MVNRYIKHMVLLLACWVGFVCCGFCQQADSAANAQDTAIEQAGAGSAAAGTSNGDTTPTNALDKFTLIKQHHVVSERKIPGGEVKKITSDDDFWYANKPMPGDEPVQRNNWLASVLQIVFWVLVAGIVAAILIVCIRLFANKSKGIYKPAAAAEGAADNIFDIDFDSRIKKALDEHDYRLATRLMFLRLLRAMAERNIIQYSIEKTNFDYLFEMGGSKYTKDFSNVARNYEYVWYGNFNIQQTQFLILKQRLDELSQQISN